MAAAATPRKSVSIHDYPEHLNPFREDDNHNKIRFWTIGRKLTRSNSINFSGIKDLRNSWTLRSFMKKGKKSESSGVTNKTAATVKVNGQSSPVDPVVYRRASHYTSAVPPAASVRTTLASPERPDRYVYGGSVTPLPRSRFQERLRSPSQYDVDSIRGGMDQSVHLTPRMARSEISGSRHSVDSTNPFEDGPVPPVRASRRKKKRAPPPPPTSANSSLVTSTQLDSSVVSEINESKRNSEVEMEDLSLNVELKIVEDEDTKENKKENKPKEKSEEGVNEKASSVHNANDIMPHNNDDEITPKESKENSPSKDKSSNPADNIKFAKVDIRTYRRNSSINENDIQLRRGNLEDFIPITTRSKSLSNAINTNNNNYVTCDINANSEVLDNEDMDPNQNAQKVICKYDETARKQSVDTVSSTEKEFIAIDIATKELEREISKLNMALKEDEPKINSDRLSVTDIKRKFDNINANSPNPIPKPKRSNNSPSSPVNGKAVMN